jgi:hypothetical protein
MGTTEIKNRNTAFLLKKTRRWWDGRNVSFDHRVKDIISTSYKSKVTVGGLCLLWNKRYFKEVTLEPDQIGKDYNNCWILVKGKFLGIEVSVLLLYASTEVKQRSDFFKELTIK